MARRKLDVLSERIIKRIAGLEGVHVWRVLKKGKYHVDEIAEMSKLPDYTTYRILHILDDAGFIRYEVREKKESAKDDFFVEPAPLNGLKVTVERHRSTIELLRDWEEKLSRGDYVSCGTPGHPVLPFDTAFHVDFTCPQCGKIMNPYSFDVELEAIRKEIEWREKEVNEINRVLKRAARS